MIGSVNLWLEVAVIIVVVMFGKCLATFKTFSGTDRNYDCTVTLIYRVDIL